MNSNKALKLRHGALVLALALTLPATAAWSAETGAAAAKAAPTKKAPVKKAKRTTRAKKATPMRTVAPAPQSPSMADRAEVLPPINAVIGKSMLIRLPAPVTRMSVGNPVVADVNLLNPQEIYLLGKEIGSTNLIVWYRGGGTSVADINVNIDTAALQGQLSELLRGQNIHVSTAADSIVLQGTVSDALKVDEAASIAEAYVRKFNRSLVTDVNMPGKEQAVNIKLGQSAAGNVRVAGARIINMLTVGAPQQVMLEVKIAEINKTLAEKLGLDFARQFTGGGGTWTKTISGIIGGGPASLGRTSNVLRSGSTGASSAIGSSSVSSASGTTGYSPATVLGTLDSPLGFTSNFLNQNPLGATVSGGATTSAGVTVPAGTAIPTTLLQNTDELINKLATSATNTQNATSSTLSQIVPPTVKDFTSWLVDAQKQDGLVKILAEPNIVAISGQEGSFLAGGEILIPVPQAQGTVTLESKKFGVGLSFVPTVLDDDRINIKVAPEVTDLVGFNTVATTGLGAAVAVPTFTTRRVTTTVQLREGQSLAIGGLLQDNYREAVQRFPILGEIPILGTLFRSSNYQKEKTELLVVVTPRLIKPLAPDYVLPTDGFVEPSRSEFLIGGKMEGSKTQSNQAESKEPESTQPVSNAPVGARSGSNGFELK